MFQNSGVGHIIAAAAGFHIAAAAAGFDTAAAAAPCMGIPEDTLGAPAAENIAAETFADASWADDKSNRRSTHGYVCFLNGGPVSWHSRQGKFVALSTAEAELAPASDAGKDLVHRGM